MTQVSSLFFDDMVLGLSRPGQFGFQGPYGPLMEGIIDLHDYICFFLIMILTAVCWMLAFTIYYYSYSSLASQALQATLNSKLKDTNQNFFNNFCTNFIGVVKYQETKHFSHWTLLEFVWTVLPAFVLLFIVVPSFILLYTMDESASNMVLTLKVIGHQWYWTYDYANPSFYNFKLGHEAQTSFSFDSFMIVNDNSILSNVESLRLLQVDKPVWLPSNVHVRVILTSTDVIHSWAIPSFGIKVDAVPGRLNQTFLFVNQSGRFFGQCSEICGANHGFMPIEVICVPWEQWVKFFENGFKQ